MSATISLVQQKIIPSILKPKKAMLNHIKIKHSQIAVTCLISICWHVSFNNQSEIRKKKIITLCIYPRVFEWKAIGTMTTHVLVTNGKEKNTKRNWDPHTKRLLTWQRFTKRVEIKNLRVIILKIEQNVYTYIWKYLCIKSG